MGTTTSEASRQSILETPVRFGVVLGAVLGIFQRFLLPFDLATVGVTFAVVGTVLVFFGRSSWFDVGRVLAATGFTGLFALKAIGAVF